MRKVVLHHPLEEVQQVLTAGRLCIHELPVSATSWENLPC